MKIITKNKVYVQYIDIAYLIKSKSYKQAPDSISDKCFTELFVCNEYNKYNFVEFNRRDEIKFFDNLDYIIDYLEVKELSNEQIIQKVFEIGKEKNKLYNRFIYMSNRDKYLNIHILTEIELLEFKMESLMNIIALKNDKLKMNLPNTEQEKKLIKEIKKVSKKIM